MQKEAMECLQKNDGNAIIIMPTGSGKTYLMWTHCDKSQCSIVFAPYRILVQQLADILQGHGTTFTWPFQDMRVSMCQILSTAQYIVMPYEAAPHADAAGLLESLHSIGRLGPVWIDEVCT
jgi:superfamily II DNA or RNA helicase